MCDEIRVALPPSEPAHGKFCQAVREGLTRIHPCARVEVRSDESLEAAAVMVDGRSAGWDVDDVHDLLWTLRLVWPLALRLLANEAPVLEPSLGQRLAGLREQWGQAKDETVLELARSVADQLPEDFGACIHTLCWRHRATLEWLESRPR